MAPIDEGSERSLIRHCSAKGLAWTDDEPTVLSLRGVGNKITDEHSKLGKLTVQIPDGSETKLTVTTMTDPVGEVSVKNWPTMKSKWPLDNRKPSQSETHRIRLFSPDQNCRARAKTQLTVPDISQAEALCKVASPVHSLTVRVQELAPNSQSRAGTGINRCKHKCTQTPST